MPTLCQFAARAGFPCSCRTKAMIKLREGRNWAYAPPCVRPLAAAVAGRGLGRARRARAATPPRSPFSGIGFVVQDSFKHPDGLSLWCSFIFGHIPNLSAMSARVAAGGEAGPHLGQVAEGVAMVSIVAHEGLGRFSTVSLALGIFWSRDLCACPPGFVSASTLSFG